MKILTVPNPILNQVCSLVDDPTNYTLFCAELVSCAARHDNCIGLAAPQVGYNDRIFVAEGVVYINPVILELRGTREAMWEGCMSIPGVKRLVVRNSIIEIEYYNTNGVRTETKLKGWSARVVQHELDHLNGILITEKQ